MSHAPFHSRRRLAAALAGLLAAPFARAAVPGVGEREIVIGQSITLEDGYNVYGSSVLQGMKLALDDANRQGGVAGRRLVLRTLDDFNDPRRAAVNARQLVAGGAFLLFGAVEGGPSTAVAAVASEARVPFFGPLAGSPGLRRPYQEMVFPVRAEHRDEFRALMSYARNIGLETVAFFHGDSEVGRTHLANVQALADEMKMKLVLPIPFQASTGEARLDEIAAEIARVRPGLCFNHGSPNLYGRLVGRVRSAGTRTMMAAVNSGSSEIVNMLGPLAHGMVFSQVVPSPWERKFPITRDYQAAVAAADPGAAYSYGALEGFLTARALLVALQASARDLSREGFVATLHRSTFEIGGVRVRYQPGTHEGSRFVDLAMFSREGRFLH